MRVSLIVLVVCCAAQVAHAHKLNLFATVSDGQISGKVYFPNAPAQGLTVVLRGGSGRDIASITSAADGTFQFEGQQHFPVTLIAETADGHRAEFRVDRDGHATESDSKNALDHGPTGNLDTVRAMVQEELKPLREQLDAQANQTRMRDVLGGIGYVLGIFGVIALLKRRAPGK